MTDISARISDYGKRCTLEAMTVEEQAARIRDEADGLDRFYDSTADSLKAMERRRLEAKASELERKARTLRRDAAYAKEGYLVMTQEKASNPELFFADEDLYCEARRAGLVYTSREDFDMPDDAE